MRSFDDERLAIAVHAELDALAVPDLDVERIIARAAAAPAEPVRRTTRRRVTAALALAATLVLVLVSGTQRGGAIGLSVDARIENTLRHTLALFNIHLPVNGAELRIEHDEPSLPLARLAADAPFPVIEPTGIPRAFAVKEMRDETHGRTGVEVHWWYMPRPKHAIDESILIREALHDPHAPAPVHHAAVPEQLFVIDVNADGSLKSVTHRSDPRHVANRRFTLGRTDVTVTVMDARPAPIADAIRSAMTVSAASTH